MCIQSLFERDRLRYGARLQMKAGGRQSGHRDTGIMSRIVSGLWLLVALLVLHGAPPLDRADFGQLDSLLNPAGTLAADERFNPPSIQPRGPISTIVNKLKNLAAKQKLVPDRDAPSAPAAAPTTIPSLVPGESLRPVAGDFRPSLVSRAFNARAPPSPT